MYISLRNSKAGHEYTIILIVVDKYIKYPMNHGHKNLVFRYLTDKGVSIAEEYFNNHRILCNTIKTVF